MSNYITYIMYIYTYSIYIILNKLYKPMSA